MNRVLSFAALAAFSANAQTPLPPDIDAQSYSRLPLILKDSLGDYTMTAMLLNAVDQHLPPDREPLLPAR